MISIFSNDFAWIKVFLRNPFFVDAKLPPWIAGNSIFLFKILLIRLAVFRLFFTNSLQSFEGMCELDFKP